MTEEKATIRDNHNIICQQNSKEKFISLYPLKKGLNCEHSACGSFLASQLQVRAGKKRGCNIRKQRHLFDIYLILNSKTFRLLDEATFQLTVVNRTLFGIKK